MSPDVRLTPTVAAALLRAAAESLRAELTALPDGILSWHPAPGEWCAKEVLGHLIEAESRGFAGRIRQILAAAHPDVQAWDQDEVARQRRDCERPLTPLLEEFLALREEGAELAGRLTAGDLSRAGRHPAVGEHTAEVLGELGLPPAEIERLAAAGVIALGPAGGDRADGGTAMEVP